MRHEIGVVELILLRQRSCATGLSRQCRVKVFRATGRCRTDCLPVLFGTQADRGKDLKGAEHCPCTQFMQRQDFSEGYGDYLRSRRSAPCQRGEVILLLQEVQ